MIPKTRLYVRNNTDIGANAGLLLDFIDGRKVPTVDIKIIIISKGSHKFIDINQAVVGLVS